MIILGVACCLLVAAAVHHSRADNPDFPEGYDAVTAASANHKVIFENAFVRVLEVTVPGAGQVVPMHHHRWPGFFLSWNEGGRTPHVRKRLPDGTVTDIPSREIPRHPGAWTIHWMDPEPMHAIDVVEPADDSPNAPTDLRIELKSVR